MHYATPTATSSGTARCLGGRSFRNYGEFDFPRIIPSNARWFDVYHDFRTKAGKIAFQQSIAPETLRKYTCPDYPGWNLSIPDSLRVEVFKKNSGNTRRAAIGRIW